MSQEATEPDDAARRGRSSARNRRSGIVNPPVYRASTVLFDSVADMHAANPPRDGTLHYGRNGTPTTWALCDALTELEPGAAMTRLYPSGAAAVAGALLSVLAAGDELLMVDTAYGPTRSLCDNVLKRFGVTTRYYDPMIGARHRRADRRAHPRHLPRKPRHPHVRGPGRAGDLRGGEGAGARHPDRQYLGDAALLSGDRGRDRPLHPRLHQIYRRPCRPDARLGDGDEGDRAEARADPARPRPDRRARRRLACAARPAHPRRPAAAAPGEWPQRSRAGSRTSRRWRACSIPRSTTVPATNIGRATSGAPPASSPSSSTAATRRRGTG